MSEYCVETISLSKYFADKKALDDINLKITRGGIHAVIGSNGAGKSTLFRILLGLEVPSSGRSFVLGENSSELSCKTRGLVGYVNEEHRLPIWMTVENIKNMQQSFYPNWNHQIYDAVISYFDVNDKQKISSLSRGERAGFNLSMALAQRPKLLILDEPTLGLDIVARRAFLEALMFAENEDGMTTIYCSHQIEEVERVAENLIILEKGGLMNYSTPEEFCKRVSYWVADFGQSRCDGTVVPGLLSCKEIDGFQHIYVKDQGESFKEYLQSKGIQEIQEMPINLSNAVNAFLTANHNKYESATEATCHV